MTIIVGITHRPKSGAGPSLGRRPHKVLDILRRSSRAIVLLIEPHRRTSARGFVVRVGEDEKHVGGEIFKDDFIGEEALDAAGLGDREVDEDATFATGEEAELLDDVGFRWVDGVAVPVFDVGLGCQVGK